MENRLFKMSKNVLINNINFSENYYEEFKKRLFLALQKSTSSRKTRAVHQIIENNLFDVGVFAGDANEYLGVSLFKENRLFLITLNVEIFADYNTSGIVSLFQQIISTTKKLEQERELITSQKIYNIKKLSEQYKILMNKFLDSFDYIKMIDGLYYEYLKFLFYRTYLTNPKEIQKFLALNSKIISKIISEIYVKTTKAQPDGELNKKFNIVSDYFILTYYFGDQSIIALKKIGKVYGKEAEEFLRKSNHLKPEEFINLTDILYDTDTFKIQKNIFEMFLKKMFGELGYKLIKANKATMDSFLSSLNHKNVLFNAISPNDKLTFEIEELVLNEKTKILLVPQRRVFLDI